MADSVQQGWQPIATAPKGQRVRVGHEADRSSMKAETICPTFGTLTDEGWQTSSYFLIPYGRRDAVIERTPTHWRPTPTKDSSHGY